jgi:hypothetical protein
MPAATLEPETAAPATLAGPLPRWTDATGYARPPAPIKATLAAIGKAASLGAYHLEFYGIHGRDNDPHLVSTMMGLAGDKVASPKARAAYVEIGTRHGWSITRDNAPAILADCAALLDRARDPASGLLEIEDNRETPEAHAAARAEGQRQEAERKAKAEAAAKVDANEAAAWHARPLVAPADVPRVPVTGCPGVTVPAWTDETARGVWPYGVLDREPSGGRGQEIAEEVRKRIAEAQAAGLVMPCKVSVRSDHNSVTVSITGCPADPFNPARAAFDKEAETSARWTPVYQRPPEYIPEVMAAIRALEAILRLYHWDKSDSQSDYFCSRFYANVHGPDRAWKLTAAPTPTAKPAAPGAAPTAAGLVRCGAKLETHQHTKHGFLMFMVTIADRLERSEWERLTAAAKATGGWYSKQWGTTPGGWAWKDEAPALAFLAAHFGAPGPDGTPEAAPTDKAEEAAAPEAAPSDADKAAIAAYRSGARTDTHAATLARVTRLRALADGLDEEAARKRGPRLANTPKRQREAGSARVDGDRAARAAGYLRAFADASEAGTLGPVLAGWKATKADALEIARQELGRERGYYDPPVESGTYVRKDNLAVAVRSLAEAAKDPARAKAEAEAKREGERQAALVRFRQSDAAGFFPSPKPLADEAARILADALGMDRPRILEPSAGVGSLVDAVRERLPGAHIHAIEVRSDCCAFLREWCNADLGISEADFLATLPGDLYDGVIMNPPYERAAGVGYQAPAHIRHALKWLKPGGTLVAIVPAGFLDGQGAEFASMDATETANDPGAFNDRREAIRTTGTRTSILVIHK